MNQLSHEHFGYSVPAASGTYRHLPQATKNTVRTQGRDRSWTPQRKEGQVHMKYQRRPRFGYYKWTLTDHRRDACQQ